MSKECIVFRGFTLISSNLYFAETVAVVMGGDKLYRGRNAVS